ncbi:iron ABC transporter permease [Staphylococcus chromogenes]|uniref:iron chelate uptake ABC transporter family permease subunit n=1 Tax=Staphylococcus chromogenes TaxID=46126 RepID=UPI000D19CBFD|nr:iron chelate uptake ABC transporter family permease subunit [Staphylococcus chromogenes]PTG91758.1 iron ABC transporter permease [Staphylococcus chromogenes]
MHNKPLKKLVILMSVTLILGAAIAASTVIFQAITVNRLLTPSIMGLDAVYLFSKVLILFLFGTSSIFITNFYLNFTVTLVVMVIFALVLFEGIFKYGQFSVYFILLIGVILGTFFRSITGFLELLINPEDFLVIQSAMFANFDGGNPTLMTVSAIVLAVLLLITVVILPYLDVLLLGRAQAINLGVHYTQMTRFLLILVALMVAIATALVGPITFLGLLTVNLAHELIKNFEHRYILPATLCISWISLFIAQWIVENVFEATTQVSILINLIGGVYFIYLLMKRREAA